MRENLNKIIIIKKKDKNDIFCIFKSKIMKLASPKSNISSSLAHTTLLRFSVRDYQNLD